MSGFIRTTLKRVVFACAWLLAVPLIILVWLEKVLSRSEVLFIAASQLLALVPSHIGVVLRAAFYFSSLEQSAWETHVGFGTVFTHRGASLGRHTSTGCYCVIGHARIGEGTMLASRVSIPSGRRQHFDDDGNVTDEARFDTVTIGERCWIGEGAIVMADVGAGAVVSAGAVVLKSMPSDVIIGGNPAHVIRPLANKSIVAV